MALCSEDGLHGKKPRRHPDVRVEEEGTTRFNDRIVTTVITAALDPTNIPDRAEGRASHVSPSLQRAT
jgi:hypothetical protein